MNFHQEQPGGLVGQLLSVVCRSQLNQEVLHLAGSILEWLMDNKLVCKLCWKLQYSGN